MREAFSANESWTVVADEWVSVAGLPASFVSPSKGRRKLVAGTWVGASLGAWTLATLCDDSFQERHVQEEVTGLAWFVESLVEEDLRVSLAGGVEDLSVAACTDRDPALAARRTLLLQEVVAVGVLLRSVPLLKSETLSAASPIRYSPFYGSLEIRPGLRPVTRPLLERPALGALEVEAMRLVSVRDAIREVCS